MNLEKYTERVRGFIQSAESLARREGHQQFTPEHILKVLLEDDQGLAAGLIDRAGGRSREALIQTELALTKLPKVHGQGAGQLYLAPTTARVFDSAERIARAPAGAVDQARGQALVVFEQHFEDVFGRELLMPFAARQRLRRLDEAAHALGIFL
ncbi:MAG: ATP-dependent Clp protease ATP-binding subunit ClpB [Methylobacteriaceae bacterium]|nr:ATP-dependent Clp protease ATP-binding subunit ClpB [Methylobacteriaceae bacterium]